MSTCKSCLWKLLALASLISTSIDVRHMPEGCATWPAYWETNDGNWPAAGEVDIVSALNWPTLNQSLKFSCVASPTLHLISKSRFCAGRSSTDPPLY